MDSRIDCDCDRHIAETMDWASPLMDSQPCSGIERSADGWGSSGEVLRSLDIAGSLVKNHNQWACYPIYILFLGISIPILVGSLIFLARVDRSQGQVPQRFRTGSQIHWEFFRSSASHWVRAAMQNSSQSFAELEHRSVGAICRH